MFWKRFSNTPDFMENREEYVELEDNNKLPNRVWEIIIGKPPYKKGFWFNFSFLFDIDYMELNFLPILSIDIWFRKFNETLSKWYRLNKIKLKKHKTSWNLIKWFVSYAWQFHYTFFCLEQQIFKTKKSYCIQFSKWEGFRTGFTFYNTSHQDHPTIELNIYFLGLVLYMYIYDNRHWSKELEYE